MALPNFLIVGAPKCGTTSLYHYLKQHPDIFMPEFKEPHFFIDWKKSVKTQADYEALFAASSGKKAIGEASTNYIYSEDTPQKIKQLIPDAKIIIMLRNPADMVFALWRHMFRKHHEKFNFREALRREPRRMADPHLHLKHSTWPANFYYFRRALYYNQVKRYIDTFGKDNVMIIIFDDFKRNPIDTCRVVFEFLQVDPSFVPEIAVHNEGIDRRSRHLYEFINYPPRPIAGIGKVLPARLRESVKSTLTRLNQKPKPVLDESLRRELLDKYKSDIDKLGELIGRDLSFWYR